MLPEIVLPTINFQRMLSFDAHAATVRNRRHFNICVHDKNPRHWQPHNCLDTGKYSMQQVIPQRWNVASLVAGELETVTYLQFASPTQVYYCLEMRKAEKKITKKQIME